MDPVVGSIVVAVVAAVIAGFFAVRAERIRATVSIQSANRNSDAMSIAAQATLVSTQTKTLLDGLQTEVNRLSANVAARDAVIEDIRADHDECERQRVEMSATINKQAAEISGLQESVKYMAGQIELLGGPTP